MDALPLTDHVPPVVALANVAEAPSQSTLVPVMAAGKALTVNTTLDEQPPMVYLMVVVPTLTALIIPSAATVATAAAELLHTPPLTILDRFVTVPAQAEAGPLMADGAALTATVRIAEQPVGNV